MVEGCGGLCFYAQAIARHRIPEQIHREKLESDGALETLIPRLHYHAHAAVADRAHQDSVALERGVEGGGGERRAGRVDRDSADEEWDEATEALRAAAQDKGLALVLDEGGGAFYGPKISVQVKDAIGRTWQMSTIQLDFQMPQRFDMHYVGADNERHRPVMIHRALFGSVERFFAVLVEHYAGAFPAWLAPVQVTVLPVSDRHDAYGFRIVDRLKAEGFRAEMVDGAAGQLGARIRRAKTEKVPYILVVGDTDVDNGTVGVNRRGSDQPERDVTVDDFVERLAVEVLEHR